MDKVNALFIKPNDCKNLVETIEYCIDNKTELRKISENAYLMTRQYTNEPIEGGKKYLAAYSQLLTQKVS